MQQPDIVLILSDDHGADDLGCAGSSDLRTPRLDALATEGMRLTRYSTPAPICAPARMAAYSGCYPVRNGGYPNHSSSYPQTRSMVHHLGTLGYRVGLHGKTHIAPNSVYNFEHVDDVAAFLDTAGRTQPVCLVIAPTEPHTRWDDHDADAFPPEELHLPPHLLDTPGSRRARARYATTVRRLDQRVGEWLATIERIGRPENTLTIYTSDHGAQFPGSKWTCYQQGLRVPMIARWPGRIPAGTTCDALVQHVDLLPTFVAAAGGDPAGLDSGLRSGPDGNTTIDGGDALPVLTGERSEHRAHAFGIATQHCTINGVPYPVRSVRDERYSLIHNPAFETTYQNVLTGPPASGHDNLYWGEWLAAADDGDERARLLVDRYLHRPEWQLFDLQDDPAEMHNRAADPALAEVRQGLTAALQDWMQQQGDGGMATELAAGERRP